MKKRPVPVSHIKALAMSGAEQAHAEESQAGRREAAAARGEPIRTQANGGGGEEIHLLLILDASPSMLPYEAIVRSGLRSFLARLGPDVAWRITLAQFDASPSNLCVSEPIAAEVVQRAIQDYDTRSGYGTALWDAIEMSLALKAGPGPALCLIASDGEDNMSRSSSLAARRAVDFRRASGGWTFLWLNMTGRPSAEAAALGIEAMDLRREDIGEALAQIASKLGKAVRRMQLEGAKRIPDLLRLE
jgi:hypothetical protein